MLPLIDASQSKAINKSERIISSFNKKFLKNWNELSLKKIGISNPQKNDNILVEELLGKITTENADFTQTFLQLNPLTSNTHFSKAPSLLQDWKKRWESRIKCERNPYQIMSGINPIFIPRNHLVEKAIKDALIGDFNFFYRLLKTSENPFQYKEFNSDLYQTPANNELVTKTFCGT